MTRILVALFCVLALAPRLTQAQTPTDSPPSDDVLIDPNTKLVKKYPFRGSTFSWGQNLTALSLDQGAEQTYNPVYSWLFRLAPRYHFTDKLSLRLRIDLAVELTNADDTTYYREPLWEDILLDAVYAKAWVEKYSKVDVTPSLRLVLPVSKASRARSIYLGFSPGFTLRRSFKLPRRLGLDVIYAFRYTKFLNEYTTVQYDAPTIASCAGTGTGDCGRFLHAGSRNASHSFNNMFVADLAITPKLHVSETIGFINNLLYDTATATIPLAGGETVVVGTDPSYDVNMRAAVTYATEVSYDLHPIVGLSFAISTFNPQLADDSTYRAPFFNRFTEFVLTATVNLDQVTARIHRRVRPRTFMASASQ